MLTRLSGMQWSALLIDFFHRKRNYYFEGTLGGSSLPQNVYKRNQRRTAQKEESPTDLQVQSDHVGEHAPRGIYASDDSRLRIGDLDLLLHRIPDIGRQVIVHDVLGYRRSDPTKSNQQKQLHFDTFGELFEQRSSTRLFKYDEIISR